MVPVRILRILIRIKNTAFEDVIFHPEKPTLTFSKTSKLSTFLPNYPKFSKLQQTRADFSKQINSGKDDYFLRI
jgi:hypothetical protein